MKKYDLGTDLLFVLLNRGLRPNIGDSHSAENLLEEHKELVDGTNAILERLGLVERDDRVLFGYKPTHDLLRIIVNRRPRLRVRKGEPSIIETDALATVYDVVPDEDHAFVCPLAQIVLEILGLIRRTDDGAAPTLEFRQLAAEQRERERNLDFPYC